MSLSTVQQQAETNVESVVQTLARDVLLTLVGKELTPVNGDVLKASVASQVNSAFGSIRTRISPFFEQTKDEALIDANNRMNLTTPVYSVHDVTRFLDVATSSFQKLRSAIRNDISILLTRGIIGSMNDPEVYSQIRRKFSTYESQARGIVHIELQYAYQETFNKRLRAIAEHASFQHKAGLPVGLGNISAITKGEEKELEPVTFEVWVHSGEGDPPRAEHLAMHNKGVVSGVDFKLVTEDGTFLTPSPRAASLPPGQAINCFHPDTVIIGSVIAATRFLYSGKMREIKTRSGHSLSVTLNHPIATIEGWKAAGSFNKGEYLLSYNSAVENIGKNVGLSNDSMSSPYDEQHPPTRINEVFGSLCLVGFRDVVVRAGLQFNGDAEFGDSDVDIVYTERELLDRTKFLNQFRDFAFLLSDTGLSFHNPDGTSSPTLSGINLPPPGSPSLADLPLDSSASVTLNSLPVKVLEFGLISNFDIAFLEVSDESRATESSGFRQLKDRLAGLVTLDEVVEIRDYDFSHYVYDVQSVSGAVIVSNSYNGGIIASNCKCSKIPVVVWMNSKEKESALVRSRETGGYIDKRFSKFGKLSV